LTENADSGDTPIRKEINRFSLMISIIAIFWGVVLFIVGFLIGYTPIQNV
jgi:magnesium-transporting ATPase (P-type)